jgi:hypothetical protein
MEKKVVASVDMSALCCGGRCPRVVRYDDGSILVEDEGKTITFNPEQADRLRSFLTK